MRTHVHRHTHFQVQIEEVLIYTATVCPRCCAGHGCNADYWAVRHAYRLTPRPHWHHRRSLVYTGNTASRGLFDEE